MNVWQPYAQMGAMSEGETVIVRGEGSYIYTDSGEKLFDSSAALWYANLGHGNRELADAAHRQMLELETYYIWAGMLHPRVVELADVLTADGIAPLPNAKVMFGAGGSDSADIAFKLARLHWQLQGRSEKRTILHRTHAYHGLHAFGTSVNGESEVREMFGPTTLVPETGIIDFENIDLVREQVLALGPETIAAIVAEPVIGAGGVYPPAPGYLPGLRQLCDELDILLIFDEVITGFGRVGEWFAAHRYQVTPDLLMFAKGITSGYQPLGGVYAGPRVWEPFWNKEAGHKFAFGTTYSGHATGCAVALKTIEILARDGHLERVKQLERRLGDGLRDHVAHLPTIESVRHEGLMASVNFNSSLDVEVLRGRMRKRGIHTRAAGDGIAISPPFITTDAEMDDLIQVLAEEASYV